MSFQPRRSLMWPRPSSPLEAFPMPEETDEPAAAPSPPKPHPSATPFGGLHAAELLCETCGRPTQHRVLHITRARRTPEGQVIEGTARCSQCRWTHPFRLELPKEVVLPAVVSTGARSAPIDVRLSSTQRLLVGSRVPHQDPPLRIVRIDLRSGRRSTDAIARDVATLWLTPDGPRAIPVSLVLGSRTAVTRAEISPDQFIEVGEPVKVAGGVLRVVGLRARNRTWTHAGDRFPAREVARIYTRRMESPPAGNSRWSRSREMPRSRTISTSRSDRSRSSPGVRIRRSRPRARSAAGGAAVQRKSPS
jgi:uncharacterized Zn finger protein